MKFREILALNVRQIAGLAIFVLGVILISCGAYNKSHLSGTEVEIHHMTQSKNSMVNAAGKDLEKKIGNYDTRVKLLYVGGAVLVLLGGGAMFFFKHKKRR